MHFAKMNNIVSMSGRIAQWFCVKHPHIYLVFRYDSGRRLLGRCRVCARERALRLKAAA